MRGLTPAAPVLLATLLTASPGPSQELEYGSSITVVSVPVFVTDSKGHSIPGLTADDFDVRADGKRVKIVGFREFDAAGEGLEQELRQNPAARRQFLLLFDLSFSSVPGLKRAREAALDFVTNKLEPSDLASIATFSADHGIRLLLGFTTDRAQLRKAVSTLGISRAGRQADPLGLVYDLTEVGGALTDLSVEDEVGANFDDLSFQMQTLYRKSEMAHYKRRVLALADGFRGLAQALDSLQGRKQVVYLSCGFDATALVGETGSQARQSSEALARGYFWVVDSDDRYGDTRLRAELREALEAFSRSDSVVHAVDLSGLSARGDGRFAGREPQRGTGHESLARIAEVSGGRLFKNTNDVGQALDEVLELSRHYYLLAFEPARVKGPGSFHKLEVKLKDKKGRRVSHRRGYFERQPFAKRSPMQRRFEAAEIIAKGVTGGELGFRAMAIPYRTDGDRTLLPVVLEFDAASLLADVTGDQLRLEIYGYALGADGSVEDLIAFFSTLDVAGARDRIEEHGMQCHAFFSLRPGPHELRFLVRDAERGRSGSRWLSVTVPEFKPGEVQLSPPIFMDESEGWLVLKAESRSTPEAQSPFTVSTDPFVPKVRPRLTNGHTERFLVLAYDGGVQYDPAAPLEIRPLLVDGSGHRVAGAHFALDRAFAEPDGFRRYVLSLTPSDLPPGEYTLKVRFRDAASGRLSEAFQTVEVGSDAQGSP